MNRLLQQENLKKFARIDECPVRNVVARFSGKWSMLILCVLSANEATRFNVLEKALPDISPKVLSETLKNLQADGLVSRRVHAEVPPRVEYSLTELGHSLMPHIENLVAWAMDNFDSIIRARVGAAK